MERIRQLSEGIASAFRGSAQMEELASAPPLQNRPGPDGGYGGAGGNAAGPGEGLPAEGGRHGSEDFASYTYELPCSLPAAGGRVPPGGSPLRPAQHNPKVVFNEDVLPLGAALLTAGAMHRLER